MSEEEVTIPKANEVAPKTEENNKEQVNNEWKVIKKEIENSTEKNCTIRMHTIKHLDQQEVVDTLRSKDYAVEIKNYDLRGSPEPEYLYISWEHFK